MRRADRLAADAQNAATRTAEGAADARRVAADPSTDERTRRQAANAAVSLARAATEYAQLAENLRNPLNEYGE
jgi:hypothetical protein